MDFKEWAESTLRASQLKDMPVRIKSKVYNIYKQDIFDRICKEIEDKLTTKLCHDDVNLNKSKFQYYQKFVNFKQIELGDPNECCNYHMPLFSSTEKENRWKWWKYEIVAPDINMEEVLKNKTYRGEAWKNTNMQDI